MKLFCFASRSVENIVRGVKARRWAVATVSDSAMKSRITKAEKYFVPGVHGLLYCEPTHSFTVPFIAASTADPRAVEKDIWPEPWVLPFDIRPLGDLSRQVKADSAMIRWPILIRRREERGIKSATAALNVTGATVFSPTEITEEDWTIILDDLATDISKPTEGRN
jgi:hypothetical protein